MTTAIKEYAECNLPTDFGTFLIKIYQFTDEITVISSGNVYNKENVAVRIHSACFTGEVLGSQKCDCKQQLDFSLKYIGKHGGVVIYLLQEGRGIGLGNKIKAYSLQQDGYNTIDANQNLGLPIDCRTYEEAIEIIKSLGIKSINLITNNPLKIKALKESGIIINQRITFPVKVNKHSASYIETKSSKMGHMYKLDKVSSLSNGFVLHKIKKQRPFVHVNFAITKEGLTNADPTNKNCLSCQKDWERVHTLREKYSAIAVGVNTWKTDRPRLNAREEYLNRKPFGQPDRIIFAGTSLVEINYEERRTFVIGNNLYNVQTGGIYLPQENHELAAPLEQLHEYQINSLLVEGGITLIHSFLDQKVVDVITVYVRTINADEAVRTVKKLLPSIQRSQFKTDRLGLGVLLSICVSKNSDLINLHK
ncbi:MAG: GTP cyclohydrolase II RibA [Ginsengibacter sp.]